MNLSIETLMNEIQAVVMKETEFEYRDESFNYSRPIRFRLQGRKRKIGHPSNCLKVEIRR